MNKDKGKVNCRECGKRSGESVRCQDCWDCRNGIQGYVKFNPKTHIYGKVYDLTQENMQIMIEEIERLTSNNNIYKSQD